MESGQSFIQSAILWSAMMTAMMLPPSLPMLQAVRRVSLDLWLPWAFALGLVGVWLGFSLVLAAMQWGGHRLVAGDFPAWITPLLFLLAGGYQFSPWKLACLKGCRSPLGFLLTSWRDGLWGSVRMGFRYGMICVGCCWALMVLLFGVGIMNVYGMLAITALVALEKFLPLPPQVVSSATGIGLLGAAALQFVWTI
jgi:predicted metal-binding membrane protein